MVDRKRPLAITPPIVVIGIVGAALTFMAIKPNGANAQATACGAALDFVQTRYRNYSQNIAVAEEPMRSAPDLGELAEILRLNPQFKSDPDLPIMRREAAVKHLSPVRECPELRRWLRTKSILHDDMKIMPLVTGKERLPFTVITLTMPVISGDKAFLYAGSACGMTCGSTQHVELQRTPRQGWMIVRVIRLSVS